MTEEIPYSYEIGRIEPLDPKLLASLLKTSDESKSEQKEDPGQKIDSEQKSSSEQKDNAEQNSEKKVPESLAECVSNELLKTMPRVDNSVFEIIRIADIKLSDVQRNRIDLEYARAREEGWDGEKLKPKRSSEAIIPVVAYAKITDQEIVYKNVCEIKYEEKYVFNQIQANGFHACYGRCPERSYGYRNDNPHVKYNWSGNSVVEIKSLWTAPNKLDLHLRPPEITSEFALLGDKALLEYFKTLIKIKKERKDLQKSLALENPSLAVLWEPIDEAFFCEGDQPVYQKTKNASLVLEIPADKSFYRHIVAVWDLADDKLLKSCVSGD